LSTLATGDQAQHDRAARTARQQETDMQVANFSFCSPWLAALAWVLTAGLVPSAQAQSRTQAWPAKPVHVVVAQGADPVGGTPAQFVQREFDKRKFIVHESGATAE
jgi:hypothetical protein